jgi:hypothetical protein
MVHLLGRLLRWRIDETGDRPSGNSGERSTERIKKMKLKGIDAAKSKEGELVLRTEPPMTEEVLQELANAWILGNEFGRDGELLVWRGGSYPERWFTQQTEIFLTEAENAVKAKMPGTDDEHQTFLKKVSEETGLPLL